MKLFREWMSIRQMNEPLTPSGSYQFSGTYNLEQMPDLIENSEKLELADALKMIPEQYNGQFGGMSDCQAGKGTTADDQEIVWVCNESGTVYIFAKT
jgi:hypothetical protein